jgi:hypothetical protein
MKDSVTFCPRLEIPAQIRANVNSLNANLQHYHYLLSKGQKARIDLDATEECPKGHNSCLSLNIFDRMSQDSKVIF